MLNFLRPSIPSSLSSSSFSFFQIELKRYLPQGPFPVLPRMRASLFCSHISSVLSLQVGDTGIMHSFIYLHKNGPPGAEWILLLTAAHYCGPGPPLTLSKCLNFIGTHHTDMAGASAFQLKSGQYLSQRPVKNTVCTVRSVDKGNENSPTLLIGM